MTDKKTQAIIARLASEHDGEVIAAARALQRMAEAKGMKIWEFLTTARNQQTHTTSNGGASGGSSDGGYTYWSMHQQYQREAERREEQMRRDNKEKAKAKQKAARDMYEEMRRGREDQQARDAFEELNKMWASGKSNWFALRGALALEVSKGVEGLTTWEKEFLVDLFTRQNISPMQREKAEEILAKLEKRKYTYK